MLRSLILFLAASIALAPATLAQRARAARPAPTEVLPWLQRQALAIDDAGVAIIAGQLRDARVIALGDGTHGTHEFLDVKRRLVLQLVESAGVRTIALEAPYGEWERMRSYVLTGEGDPDAIIASSDFFFWDTSEVMELIASVRALNAAGASIEIVGLDPSHPYPAIDQLVETVGTRDAALAASLRARYECLLDFRHAPSAYGQDASARTQCRASVQSATELLEQEAPRLEDSARLMHTARVVEQGEEALATRGANRDAAIAENVQWLAERSPGVPVVVWGHNEHLGRLPYKLGDLPTKTSAGVELAARFGARYVAIASTASSGTFHAADYARGYGVIGVHALPAGAVDDLANVLELAGRDALFVSLRGELPAGLRQTLSMRIAGSNVASIVVPTLTVRAEIPQKFDAVFYWRTTSPSALRRFPVIR